MNKSKCSGNVADDFRNMARQLERFNRQFPAEYKINFYLKQAKQQLKLTKDENRKQDMRSMVRAGRTALEAVAVKDIDGLLEAYERVHRIKEKYNLPFYQASGVSAEQRRRAKRPRRPALNKRAVICAMKAGCQTSGEARNFLLNAQELTDDWGLIDIASEGDNFIITDIDGDAKGSTLKPKRLANLVSELKNPH